MGIVQGFCAECGDYKRMYFQARDPMRSLCCVCYVKPEVRHKFGKGYMGPIGTPPHPHVISGIMQKAKIASQPRAEPIKPDMAKLDAWRRGEWRPEWSNPNIRPDGTPVPPTGRVLKKV